MLQSLRLVAAIKWIHRKVDVPDPTAAPVIGQLLQAAKRLCARPVQRRTPLSVSQFYQVVSSLTKPDESLSNLQCATLITLGFTAMLRWDDLHRLQRQDVVISNTHLSIHLKKRKNDQFRQGDVVVVCRQEHSSTRPCPVQVVERFLATAEHAPDQCLFGKITTFKAGAKLRGSMTYSRASETLHQCLQVAGITDGCYGLHSLRSGGATAAAQAGVAERLLQRHGGWRCGSSKDMYVEESMNDLLSVSRAILDA